MINTVKVNVSEVKTLPRAYPSALFHGLLGILVVRGRVMLHMMEFQQVTLSYYVFVTITCFQLTFTENIVSVKFLNLSFAQKGFLRLSWFLVAVPLLYTLFIRNFL